MMHGLGADIIYLLIGGLLSGALIYGRRIIPVDRLAQRPLLTLVGAIGVGYVYRVMDVGLYVPGFVSLMADIGLASLLFTACLFVRWSRITKVNPDALLLTLVSIPLFIALVSLSGFILINSISVWCAIILAIALTLGGAPPGRRAILNSEAPQPVKNIIRMEEPAILIFGLTLALSVEVMAATPATHTLYSEYLALLAAASSFAAGGVIAMAGMYGAKVLAKKKARPRHGSEAAFKAAILCAVIAFVALWLLGGVPVLAVGAVGLIWSEQGKISTQHRRGAFVGAQLLVTPVAYGLFGFMFGPRILNADLLTLIFALLAITLLRFLPRYLALGASSVSTGGVIFIAWVGSAPGAVCALYLLHLLSSTILIDTEQLFSIGGVCLFWGLVISRLSTDFSITQFLRYHNRQIRTPGRYG